MNRPFETYRAIHQQVFVPLFVRDDYDSHALIDACVEAGCRVIEYTQRRPDAPAMIPWIRRHFPDLKLLAGSTLDNDQIVRAARRRHPQLRTLAELADLGVDGFVSLVGWHPDNIARHAATHVIIPAAMTVNEAYQQFAAGAHFIKVFGPGVDLVRLCRSPASFEYCPVFITGGMTPDRIPEAVAAGAAVIGSGFDLMLQNRPAVCTPAEIATAIREYTRAAQTARAKAWPALKEADTMDVQSWLAALPHNHPFSGECNE